MTKQSKYREAAAQTTPRDAQKGGQGAIAERPEQRKFKRRWDREAESGRLDRLFAPFKRFFRGRRGAG
jgi:hypothetical protein